MVATLVPDEVQIAGHRVLTISTDGTTWLFCIDSGQLAALDGVTRAVLSQVLAQEPDVLAAMLDEKEFFRIGGSSDTYFSTVIPHMGCNLGCGYCINNKGRTSSGKAIRVDADFMTPEIALATAAFIGRQCKEQGKTLLHALIFGGEPLLNPELCYMLLEALGNIPGVGLLGVDMVTNATRLTAVVARRLVELGLRSVQVTFDGAQPDHDEVRAYVNGKGTYDLIVGNLAATEHVDGLRRKLRVNVTASNLPRIENLLDDLARRLTPSLYRIDFAAIDDNGIGWSDVLRPESSVTDRQIELFDYAAGLGFDPGLPSSGNCNYCSLSFGRGGSVVNADGLLYSCWDTAGFKGMTVGDVRNGYDPDTQARKWRWKACGFKSLNRDQEAQNASADALTRALFALYVQRQLDLAA